MFKQILLESFIEQYKHLPEQGTDEWKVLRKDFIGGSEVSTILKQNKNKSVNKLIMEKLGFDRFQGNVITHWGNVFEELIRLHCEEIFKCTIRETGSIPYEHGHLSYSPDGLAVIPTHKLIQQFGSLSKGLDAKAAAQLILFEFKCPHSRIASTDIPEHYWPQVNIGMNIINIMEAAIFVQATYRRCSFQSLKYDTVHNSYGHFKQADVSSNPIECGFMILYVDEWESYHEGLLDVLTENGDADQVHTKSETTLIDIGTINEPSLLEEIMGKCVNKSFKVDYCFRHMYDTNVFSRDRYTIDLYNHSIQYRAMNVLHEQLKNHPHIIGVLPYKLLNIHMTSVDKNVDYIQETNAHEKAANVLRCINDHRGQDVKAEVSKSVRRYKL